MSVPCLEIFFVSLKKSAQTGFDSWTHSVPHCACAHKIKPALKQFLFCARTRSRTWDPISISDVLYQLSYARMSCKKLNFFNFLKTYANRRHVLRARKTVEVGSWNFVSDGEQNIPDHNISK